MTEEKNIHVNYRPDQQNQDHPLSANDPGQTIVVREALDSLSSLKTIPKDLNQISESLEKAVQPKTSTFIIYALCIVIVAALAYLLIASHLNEILATNRLQVSGEIEKTRRDNLQSLNTLKDTYKENIEVLNKNISGQTTAINKQIETNYKIMQDAYKKRELHLQSLLDQKNADFEKLSLEHKAALKENERLQSALNAISSKRENR